MAANSSKSCESDKDLSIKSNLNEDVDNSDSGITMLDVLEEEENLENDANAVLGASDDQNCTYIEGYINRQALYACKTCIGENESAGICLACSYACHEGHDLIELYTKRKFRCDCGNSKFSKNPCSLWKGKDEINIENEYNQNFQGKYCTCSRPYPDPEDDVADEMIQCIMCEDWYHGRHLGNKIPSNEDFSELICPSCMMKYSFLRPYYVSPIGTKLENVSGEKDTVSVEENDENCTIPEKTVIETEETNKGDNSCLLKTLPQLKGDESGACFWPDGWRNKLCKCKDCKELYCSNKCEFLLDWEDTVHAYEERGKLKQQSGGETSRYNKGLSALNQMDRVRQVEAIHEYNNMKTKLKDYLKTFAQEKKVVREEDIHDFFNKMQAKKRQKTGNDALQMTYFCR